MLHGCSIGDGSLIGMTATVLNGAVIGQNVLIGAGALITEGKVIPDGVLVIGRPGKVSRDLTAAEIEGLARSAAGYRANAGALPRRAQTSIALSAVIRRLGARSR